MSSLGTMVQDLLIDLDEVDDVAQLNRLRHKIAQAIEHHKGRRYWFLVSRFRLAMNGAGASYDLSETVPEVRSIIGDSAWLLVAGDEDNRREMTRRSFRYMESLLSGVSVASSYPHDFSLHGHEIMIYPPPSGSQHVMTGWGKLVAESPRPEYDQGSGLWDYPSDSFTNIWFTEGYQLIREYAAWLLLSGPLADRRRALSSQERYTMIDRDILLAGEEMQMMEQMEASW